MRKIKRRTYPKHLLPKKNYRIIPASVSLDRYDLMRFADEVVDIDSAKPEDLFQPSRIKKGISVNLLAVYKKCDARYVITKHSENYVCNTDWHEGDSCISPPRFIYSKHRKYVGINVGELMKISVLFGLKNAKGKIKRTDPVYFKIVHAPTLSNFWHFNIELYAKDSNNNFERYEFNQNHPDVSLNQMIHAAESLIEELTDKILMPKDMRARYLPKRIYIK